MSLISDPLDTLLGSRTKVRLLRFLVSTGEPCSAREASRQVGMAKRGIDAALRELVQSGAVIRKELGGQPLYRINRSSALVQDAIVPLFKGEVAATQELFETLRDCVTVEGGGVPLWAGIYGSTAMGSDEPASDLDFAVVVETKELVESMQAKLSQAAPKLRRTFGRIFSPLVVTQQQLQRLAAAEDPLIQSLRTSRRVAGSVTALEKLLHGAH